jgi:hypothetical protein
MLLDAIGLLARGLTLLSRATKLLERLIEAHHDSLPDRELPGGWRAGNRFGDERFVIGFLFRVKLAFDQALAR